MRQKEQKLIVTFFTTADAMAMEQACRKRQAQGRLIPVPKSISAGCGLAWCADPQYEETLREILQSAGIQEEAMQVCLV